MTNVKRTRIPKVLVVLFALLTSVAAVGASATPAGAAGCREAEGGTVHLGSDSGGAFYYEALRRFVPAGSDCGGIHISKFAGSAPGTFRVRTFVNGVSSSVGRWVTVPADYAYRIVRGYLAPGTEYRVESKTYIVPWGVRD